MPFYQITYACPLTPTQQDTVAEAITSIHLTKFPLVPKLFVNIAFTDTSEQASYIGGQRRRSNNLVAQLRQGNRTTADFEDIRDQLEGAWEKIVVKPAQDKLGLDEGAKYRLHRLIICPTNLVGKEAGFEVPLAGEEEVWMEKHWAEFKKRADAGDEQFVDLVKTVEARKTDS